MKKFFSLMVVLTAAIAMNATVVTLTPADFSAATSAATSATVSGVTASLTSGTITADQIRIFKNQTITISCEAPISAIVFTCTANGTSQYGPGCFAAQEGYSYNNKIGTWIGEATSVAFKAETNQVRATKIEVYLDGEKPDPSQGEAIKVDVAGAVAVGMALDSAKTTTDDYEVTGYVVYSQPYNKQYNNQIWFMVDDVNKPDSLFEAYACTVSENNVIMQVIDGDKVKLTGSITKYWDAANSKFIIEIKNGTAEFIEKAEGDHNIPEDKVDTVTVARALEIIDALEEGGKTTEKYVVKGFAGTAYAMEDGKQTWYMADEAGAYCTFQAASCTPDREVVDGDYMLVTGNLTKYKSKSGNIIPEIYNGTAVHGEAPVIEVLEVSVAEALEIGNALADGAATAEMYAVSGYVVRAKDYEDGKQTFYMADEKDAAYGAFTAFKAKIEAPGVVAGDFVEVIGHIKKYVAEGADPTIEIENGTAKVIGEQGIENITLTEDAQKVLMDGVLYIIRDNKAYNVQGIRVR